MPRWPEGHITKRTCPECGGYKTYYAKTCRGCAPKQTPLAGRTGANHPAWKGGRRVDRDGYVRLYRPDHPWPRRGGYVLEHVAAMELALGRQMRSDEAVHHKDGNRQNNDLANLEVLPWGKHSSHHRRLDTSRRKRDALGRFAPD